MAQEFQSTLPARGATRWFGRSPKQNSISIHAPRTGSDSYSNFAYARCKNFNPRSPHGERRFRPEPVAPTQDISIHAPRTGSDENKRKRRTAGKFQSTLPARGATPSTAQWRQASRNFNPRSPHGERLKVTSSLSWQTTDFNPRSPHGERPFLLCVQRRLFQFQSTLPARGATLRIRFVRLDGNISIHAPRTGSDAHKTAPPRRG